MNKKLIKTFGALVGIGAVASGSAIGLTSCGENASQQNHPTGLVDFDVEYKTKILEVSIADTKINVADTELIVAIFKNKVNGKYLPSTLIQETVLDKSGLVSSKFSVVESGDGGIIPFKSTIKIAATALVTGDIGQYSIVYTAKGFVTWALSLVVSA